MLNIDMLSVNMELGIVFKIDASLVISEDGDRRELRVLAIKILTQKEVFSRLSECHILCFGGGQGYRGLL
jgi:hypothetical protein